MNAQDFVLFVRKHPVSVGCGALALLLAGATYYRSSDVGRLQDEVAALAKDGERLKNNLRNATKLDEQAATLNRAVEDVTRRAINPAALAVNLQYFYRLESEIGVKLIDLRQGTAEKGKGNPAFVPVPYTVAVEGTYRQLLQFIRSLETGSHYVKFLSTDFAVSRSADTDRKDPTDPVMVLSVNLQILGRP